MSLSSRARCNKSKENLLGSKRSVDWRVVRRNDFLKKNQVATVWFLVFQVKENSFPIIRFKSAQLAGVDCLDMACGDTISLNRIKDVMDRSSCHYAHGIFYDDLRTLWMRLCDVYDGEDIFYHNKSEIYKIVNNDHSLIEVDDETVGLSVLLLNTTSLMDVSCCC